MKHYVLPKSELISVCGVSAEYLRGFGSGGPVICKWFAEFRTGFMMSIEDDGTSRRSKETFIDENIKTKNSITSIDLKMKFIEVADTLKNVANYYANPM